MKRKLKWIILLVMLSLSILIIHVQLVINMTIRKHAFHFVSSWPGRLYNIGTINNIKVSEKNNTHDNNNDCIPMCPENSPLLVGNFSPHLSVPTAANMSKLMTWVMDGGRSSPADCLPRHHVALIIPFRDREQHLRIFLHNMHPFLRRQQLNYGIYVIEQVGISNFNRAMLMNVGFVESLKFYNYTCFVFHDVDLIPEDDRNLYSCSTQPKHLSAAVDKFNYKLPYTAIFGGASALSHDQMMKLNGFSNNFFGWGGEDDDMANRINNARFTIVRNPTDFARYRMLKHGKEKGNKPNKRRHKLLKEGPKRFKKDGLNSLKYKIVKVQKDSFYTRISVEINENEIMQS